MIKPQLSIQKTMLAHVNFLLVSERSDFELLYSSPFNFLAKNKTLLHSTFLFHAIWQYLILILGHFQIFQQVISYKPNSHTHPLKERRKRKQKRWYFSHQIQVPFSCEMKGNSRSKFECLRHQALAGAIKTQEHLAALWTKGKIWNTAFLPIEEGSRFYSP